MSGFDRYIFRTTFGAFLLIAISLTMVIWLTHALREIDLMTNQRQTVLVFVGITGLLIPMLLAIIAPIALVVAIGHTLNRLNTDSEIVVMNAVRHVAVAHLPPVSHHDAGRFGRWSPA